MALVWSAGAERSGDPALAHLPKHRSRSARVPPGQLPGRPGRDSSRSLTRKPKRRRRFPETFPYFAKRKACFKGPFSVPTEGKITVLKAGAQWEVLAVNEIGDEVNATPALSDGRLYVRTRSALYCFSTTR